MKIQRTKNEKEIKPKYQIYEPVSGQYMQTTNPLLLLGLKLKKTI